ncbi:MAG: ABC transporter permease [Planctomycetes bacterium]|nr:ABC transporter permease [Planctomycetota bacterium]
MPALPSPPTPATLEARPGESGSPCLVLSGSLDAQGAAALWRAAVEAVERAAGAGDGGSAVAGAGAAANTIMVEASAVASCDTAGAALLLEMRRTAARRGAELRLSGLRPEFDRLLAPFDPGEFPSGRFRPPSPPVVEEVGRMVVALAADLRAQVAFVGEMVVEAAGAVVAPRRVRWKDALLTMERAGVNALPIVALLGFLVGLILAFQAAVALRQFAAETFVANLVAIGLLRELGPLMTAVVLAGRSGSAFAAEIGTMQVNEEVAALSTMGLSPARFLALPRVIAGVVVTPMLTLFMNVVGLLGAAAVVVSLNIPPTTFLSHVRSAVTTGDLLGGLAMSVVFGLLVSAVGCYRGLQTGAGAAAVGLSTTAAVVSGIVLIVAADGVFAVIFYALGI